MPALYNPYAPRKIKWRKRSNPTRQSREIYHLDKVERELVGVLSFVRKRRRSLKRTVSRKIRYPKRGLHKQFKENP